MSNARAVEVPLLPDVGPIAPWLAVALFVMSIVGAAELVAGAQAALWVPEWRDRMTGSLTVAVAGQGLESADAAVERAAEILRARPGVSKVQVLPDSPADAALAGLIGGAPPPARLLAVNLRDTADRPNLEARLARPLLRGAGLTAAIDDHGAWTGPVERSANLVGIAAAGVFLALMISVVSFTIASTERLIDGREGQVRLLVQLGATEGMLGGLCAGRAAATALVAAGLAAIVVAASAGAVIAAADAGSLTGLNGLFAGPLDMWVLTAAGGWPPFCTALAAAVANITGRRGLRRLS